jgi:hypothetical protein
LLRHHHHYPDPHAHHFHWHPLSVNIRQNLGLPLVPLLSAYTYFQLAEPLEHRSTHRLALLFPSLGTFSQCTQPSHSITADVLAFGFPSCGSGNEAFHQFDQHAIVPAKTRVFPVSNLQSRLDQLANLAQYSICLPLTSMWPAREAYYLAPPVRILPALEATFDISGHCTLLQTNEG